MMKKTLSLIIAIIFLLPLIGCGKAKKENLINFYYPRSKYTYNSPDSVISFEQRERNSDTGIKDILAEYMSGPKDITLKNPFPKDISLIAVQTEGSTLFITVSDHLAELTDTDLIIACVSLAKTGMELSETNSVLIECETLLLNGSRSITIDADNIIYMDQVPAETNETD